MLRRDRDGRPRSGLGIQRGRALVLLGSWAAGMVAFVTGCVAFQTFAGGAAGPTVSFPAMAVFVAGHGVKLACVLLLGALTAVGIELAHPGDMSGP